MVWVAGKYLYQACPVNRIQAENVKVFLLNIHILNIHLYHEL